MRQSLSRVVIVVAALLAAAGCTDDNDETAPTTTSSSVATSSTVALPGGTSTSTTTATTAPPPGTIVIEGFRFNSATTKGGAFVNVRNTSSVAHTVTADNGAFDHEVAAGATAGIAAPAQPGDYPFHCRFHPQMKATLTVR